ncbi:MAG: trypsin-like peptidase domain-containing protein [Planctomycetota bacterium]
MLISLLTASAPLLMGPSVAPQLTPTAATDLSDEFARRMTPEVMVVQAAMPAVVHIETEVVVQSGWGIFGPQERAATSSGSGVVIFEDGFVVTNFHVVKGARQLRVRFDPAQDERVYTATIVSSVPEEDLALLKIDAEGPFPTVPLGTSSDLMIAEPVIAIGNPYGQSMTVSRGIISGKHRDVQADGLRFTDLIQTDASINPGNSGGPLLNINGQLIGINTVVNRAAENMGFAIAVDRVREVLEESLLSPSMAAAWFGFELGAEDTVVTDVMPGSPADLAELRTGDRIVGIDGRAVGTLEEFTRARLPIQPGKLVRLGIERRGRPRVIEVSGWNRRDATLYQRMGVLVEQAVLGGNRLRRYLQVADVAPKSPAATLGLRVGDLIEAYAVAGSRTARPARSAEELAILLSSLPPETGLVLDILRDSNGNSIYESRGGELMRGTLELR